MAARKKTSAPWWAATAVAVGLILIPDPITTGTGLAILAYNLGSAAMK